MIALDADALGAIVRLMGDDVPDGFEELAALSYGPGSAWAGTEPYDGPCPHGGECGPFPSTFELLVLDYLRVTGRQPARLEPDARDEGEEMEELPF